MTARAFALWIAGAAFGLMAATISVNVALDPEEVFGTRGAAPRVNANTRYRAYLAYRAAPKDKDGVLFSSSRGSAFDQKVLAAKMGATAIADFNVNFGLVTDHLPTLEYLVRDKAARGERLRAVLLMIDVDQFGRTAWTNRNLSAFLAPEVSGEHPLRFWTRYLTVFQFRVWLASIRRDPGRRADVPAGPTPHSPLRDRLVPYRASLVPPLRVAAADTPPEAAAAAARRGREIVIRPQLEPQLAMLAKMAALCREHGIQFTVVTSPLSTLNAAGYDPNDLERVAERIARVVPLWDFGAPAWLSERTELWIGPSYFTKVVGGWMLDRAFGPAPSAPAPFGRLRKP
jgi:hypothetical protein